MLEHSGSDRAVAAVCATNGAPEVSVESTACGSATGMYQMVANRATAICCGAQSVKSTLKWGNRMMVKALERVGENL